MDIFVRNVPPYSTNKQLEKYFSTPLRECGITIFHTDKIKDRPFAVLTILDTAAGQQFLALYCVPQNSPPRVRAVKPLRWDGKALICAKSRTQSDFSARSLVYEATQQTTENASAAQRSHQAAARSRFDIKGLHCGVWDYSGSQLALTTHFNVRATGTVTFGSREAIILLGDAHADQTRIDISYHLCDNVVLGTHNDPSITFTMNGMAPKFYQKSSQDVLSTALTALTLGSSTARRPAPKKTRLAGINEAHSKVAGACFVYRVILTDGSMLSSVKSLLVRNSKAPSKFSVRSPILLPSESWEKSKALLNIELQDASRLGTEPFALRFQLDRLARNGRLAPQRVLGLLPKVRRLHKEHGLDATSSALRHFYHDIPPAGPTTEAAQLSIAALEEMLETAALAYNKYNPENPYELAKRYAHINLVHKAVVTPTGTYLEGPEPEPTNRVLRQYPTQTDHFLRVVFEDEDGGAVRYDPRTTQDFIYRERFRQVLDGSIIIAGLGFSFLGFSHSSLRSQSCWFMAPVVSQGTLKFAPMVIKELGDFSHIRTPAKCAARIGQCFTDTNTSVKLDPTKIGVLETVERNGRDFSDGVGTISPGLLKAVWRVYGLKRLLKPTILQIRFQGAKGVVSLDTRLEGQRLLLRSNMMKFVGSNSWDLEICGAAYRPLPMVLNRQFIKILEDLSVSIYAFVDLQKAAVDKLRCMTTCATNSATLLESVEMTRATNVPSLIKLLEQIGLDYREDQFLYGIVEMAVVNQLRDIKYRGRIPVEQGVTLYGIMDETNFLKEGEVYVATEGGAQPGRDDRARDRIIVTRSPAMHPGDVQVVNAVDVPADSPLKQLSNVVVFSQQGARDLPSQLSGGDLDGDLYNVVWDRTLIPKTTCLAADYPKVTPAVLDREVTAKDMSDFFVKFMETDQLGMLCNIHLQLADHLPDGTFSPECIMLAGMSSTAVDYSKTGIPVNMQECPKYERCRPDFMAPSPRVYVSDEGYIGFEDEETAEDEAFEDLDMEKRPMRYYASYKALGYLYRAIDEKRFLETMQSQHRAITSRVTIAPTMSRLLAYMKTWTSQYGIIHVHHQALAKEIRSAYEDSLLDILYHYEPAANIPLSEREVFAGSILGRQGGSQGKPLRELSKTMRERFETVVEYATARIVHGDPAVHAADDLDDLYDDRELEALPRAIACLSVAVSERGLVDRKVGELKSFTYIAAGICLRELHRFRATTFGSMGPLPGV